MLQNSGMGQIDIHLCLNIKRHISEDVVLTGMYNDKYIYSFDTYTKYSNGLRKNGCSWDILFIVQIVKNIVATRSHVSQLICLVCIGVIRI